MVEIAPLKAQDILDILADGIVECNMRTSDPNDAIRQLAQRYEKCIGSVTGRENGKPLFCAVLSVMWPGVGNLVALISVNFVAHKIAGCRAAREVLEGMIETNHLHRVHTTVRCDFRAGQRFAEWLGFQAEGIARKYTYDQMDSIYYAIVRA